MDNTEKYGNLVLLNPEDGSINDNVSLDSIVACLNNMIVYLNAEAKYAQRLVEDKILFIKRVYVDAKEGIPRIQTDPKILEREDIY